MEMLLRKLHEAGARFIVIGGQAMLQEGMPRFTLDWDLFIPPKDSQNFEKINRALANELDMELVPFDPMTGEGFVQTFQTSFGVLQFHQAPIGLPKFDIVEARAKTCDYHGIPLKYLNLEDLLQSKIAVSRGKDSDDILFLKTKKEYLRTGTGK